MTAQESVYNPRPPTNNKDLPIQAQPEERARKRVPNWYDDET